jgi:hypothetical protein
MLDVGCARQRLGEAGAGLGLEQQIREAGASEIGVDEQHPESAGEDPREAHRHRGGAFTMVRRRDHHRREWCRAPGLENRAGQPLELAGVGRARTAGSVVLLRGIEDGRRLPPAQPLCPL